MKRSTSFTVEDGQFTKRPPLVLQPLVLPQAQDLTPPPTLTFDIYVEGEEEETPPSSPNQNKQENSDLKKLFKKGVHSYHEKRYEEALLCFQLVANDSIGDVYEEAVSALAHVQNRLGYQCLLEQNYEKAKEWFVLSSQHNNDAALFNLGLMQYKGQGGEVNLEAAYIHLERASKLGHLKARKCLWRVCKKQATHYFNRNQFKSALRWLRAAQDAGCLSVLNSIFIVEFQIGLQLYRLKKYPEALKWWDRGAKNGHQRSIHYTRIAKKKFEL